MKNPRDFWNESGVKVCADNHGLTNISLCFRHADPGVPWLLYVAWIVGRIKNRVPKIIVFPCLSLIITVITVFSNQCESLGWTWEDLGIYRSISKHIAAILLFDRYLRLAMMWVWPGEATLSPNPLTQQTTDASKFVSLRQGLADNQQYSLDDERSRWRLVQLPDAANCRVLDGCRYTMIYPIISPNWRLFIVGCAYH